MENIIAFPGLGLEFAINPVAFSIGSFPIYWYGIIATLGIGSGIFYCYRNCKEFGIHDDPLTDIILVGIFSGVVGARIYYVAFQWDYYSQHLDEVWKIHNGGIAIYGGIIGGALGIWLMCRRKKISVISVFDLVVPGLLLGQGIGRWGNFVNVEAFGGNTTLAWGMTSPKVTSYLTNMLPTLLEDGIVVDPNMPVHPTFFYESVWLVIGFFVLASYTKKRKFKGELTLMFLAWNGAGRAVIEGLRTDSLMLGSFRVSQMLAIVAVIIALFLLSKFRKNIPAVLAYETASTANQGDILEQADISKDEQEFKEIEKIEEEQK